MENTQERINFIGDDNRVVLLIVHEPKGEPVAFSVDRRFVDRVYAAQTIFSENRKNVATVNAAREVRNAENKGLKVWIDQNDWIHIVAKGDPKGERFVKFNVQNNYDPFLSGGFDRDGVLILANNPGTVAEVASRDAKKGLIFPPEGLRAGRGNNPPYFLNGPVEQAPEKQ